jgi:uncharacterized protein (TIGR03435 family)
MRTLLALSLLGISAASLPLAAQNTKLQFEVASVRPLPPTGGGQAVNVGVRIDGQQVHITSFALRDYIAMGYKIPADRITGPDAIETRYELQATFPAGAKPADLPELVQALLVERFGLKVHQDMPEVPVYALARGKGALGMKEVEAVPANATGRYEGGGTGSAQGVSVNLGNGASYTFANGKWEGKKLTVPLFADQIATYLDRPVVDQTGLTGTYDVTVEVAQEDAQLMMLRAAKRSGYVLPPQLLQRMDSATFTTLEGAFEKIGLKLEPKKLPLPRIVVDTVLAKPTEN